MNQLANIDSATAKSVAQRSAQLFNLKRRHTHVQLADYHRTLSRVAGAEHPLVFTAQITPTHHVKLTDDGSFINNNFSMPNELVVAK
eukprot:IDg11213t1